LNGNAFSQEYLYEYKRILVDPSLTDNHIYDVSRDKYGMIWLGTGVGLFRFDGYSSEKIEYHTDKITQHEEPINKIAYYGDTLFVGDNEGIHAINCFSHEPYDIDKTPHNKILGLISDPETGVWWLNEKGVLTNYHHNKKRSVLLSTNMNVLKAELFSKNQQLWIAMTFAYGHQTVLFDEVKMKGQNWQSVAAYKNFVRNIRADLNGNVNLFATPQPYSWDKNTKGFTTLKGIDDNVYDLINTENGIFSIIGENQLYHNVNSQTKQEEIRITLGTDKPENLYKIFEINGCIYVAGSNGLVVVKYKKNLFQNIFSTYNAKENSFWVPRGITEDKENIYLATYLQIIKFNRISNVSEIIDQNTLALRALLKDADTIWAGTEGGGIKKFVLSNKRGSTLQPDKIKEGTTLVCLTKLDENRIIAGGSKTLFIYDKRNKKTTDINVTLTGKNISETRINQIIVLKKNELLIATGTGAYLINEMGKVIIDYTRKLTQLKELNVYGLFKSNDNSIWTATENGIFQLDESGNVISHLTKREGLAGDLVISLVPDNSGHLWAASFTGLSCIDIKAKTINNYYKEDGLPDNEFNHSSFFHSSDGSIVLGSVNGFIKFNPDKVNFSRKQNTEINISKIEAGNQQENEINLKIKNDNKTPIKLGKHIKYVKISFFITPIDVFRNTQYEYKIEGVHAGWISMGNVPVLHIDNFKPGEYNLLIRAITGSGSRSIFTKSYSLLVEEFFYNTRWFYATMFSVILLLIILYLIAVLQRNKKIINIRQHISQDLHDEIGGYLTGITMNLELLQKNRGSENKYYSMIQTLGRNAMLALKDSLWSLDSKSDTAEELWDWVKNMASETYENLDIDFHFQQTDGLEKIKLNMLEKSYLVYIIKECITNSIKYGDRKLVRFSWEKPNGLHTITISNRMGNQDADLKTGYGLLNIENRMKKIKGKYSLKIEKEHFNVILELNFLQ
jgi:ligand-binding sensor domain-containing protein/two-component sensor histidine kinase